MASSLQFIEGPALTEAQQILDINDVHVDADDMFGGLDVNHASMDVKIPQLLTRELANNNLGLAMSGPGMGRGLVTHRPLAEARFIPKCLPVSIIFVLYLFNVSYARPYAYLY